MDTTPDPKRPCGSAQQMHHTHSVSSSASVTAQVTTGLAAAFNLLAVLVICFVVMPRVTDTAEQVRHNNELVKANHDLLEKNMELNKRSLGGAQSRREEMQKLSDTLDRMLRKLDK